MDKSKRPSAKTISLSQFFFLTTGLISVIFVAAIFYIIVIFQKSTDSILEKEITDHIADTTGILTRTFDRYLLIGKQLTEEKEIEQFIDAPEENVNIGHNIITAKMNFGIEEMFLLSSNGKILFQSAQDASILTNEEFKKIIKGIFDTNTRRGVFIDSDIYANPVFYIAFPMDRGENRGMLVLGKVFNQEYLKKLFPLEQRGIIIFSKNRKGEITSSNADTIIFNKILSSVPLKDAITKISGEDIFSYKSITDDFTGLLKIKNLRYNTFPVGTIGFYINTKEISDIHNDFLYTALLSLFIISILQTIVLILIRRLISFPVLRLKSGFKKVTTGDFGVQLETARGLRDIRSINISFNETVVKLRDIYRGLEKKIRERTKMLQEKLTELENAKTAMLNLLEDAQILGEKLQEEKASIEQKVQKRTRELNEERARFLASIYSLSLGFILADSHHQVILKNNATNLILNLPADHLTIETVAEILKDLADVKAKAEQCMKQKKTVELREVEYGEKFLRLLFVPIIMLRDLNEVIGYVLLIEDVTREREIDRAKTEFVSLASHQLRTPLAGIKWFIELLIKGKAGKLDKKVIDYLEQISISNDRMIKLVRDLLDVSRIETGKRFEIIKRKINIEDILESSLRDTSTLAKEEKVKIIKRGLWKDSELWADPDKIKQVLDNLIGNAIKYTKKNGRAEIDCYRKGNEVIFSIKDNGIGIPEYQQKRIFEKFFRADNAVPKDPRGNGLGLYVAKTLIEAHDGKMWFESEENKGTTFYFSLPLTNN